MFVLNFGIAMEVFFVKSSLLNDLIAEVEQTWNLFEVLMNL